VCVRSCIATHLRICTLEAVCHRFVHESRHKGTVFKFQLLLKCRADSITWDMVAKEAGTGKAYLHEHKDVNGQPVIVIRSSLHKTGTNFKACLASAQDETKSAFDI